MPAPDRAAFYSDRDVDSAFARLRASGLVVHQLGSRGFQIGLGEILSRAEIVERARALPA